MCRLLKQGKTLANVAALFNIGKSTVHDIIKNEDNEVKVRTFLTEVQDGDSIKKRKMSRGLILMNWTKLCFFGLSNKDAVAS